MEQLISSQAFLRSLRTEAGRQREYFTRRSAPDIAADWQAIENLAHQALTLGQPLRVNILFRGTENIPIKACE